DRASRPVKLGEVPVIKLEGQTPVSPEEAAKIKRLIAGLAEIKDPDFGLSPTMSGEAFAPIAGSEHASAFVLTNHRLRPSAALRELVALGPRALPFLLDALDDQTPTGLIIRHPGGFGGMWSAYEMRGNPANTREQRVLASLPVIDNPFKNQIKSHTVT